MRAWRVALHAITGDWCSFVWADDVLEAAYSDADDGAARRERRPPDASSSPAARRSRRDGDVAPYYADRRRVSRRRSSTRRGSSSGGSRSRRSAPYTRPQRRARRLRPPRPDSTTRAGTTTSAIRTATTSASFRSSPRRGRGRAARRAPRDARRLDVEHDPPRDCASTSGRSLAVHVQPPPRLGAGGPSAGVPGADRLRRMAERRLTLCSLMLGGDGARLRPRRVRERGSRVPRVPPARLPGDAPPRRFAEHRGV